MVHALPTSLSARERARTLLGEAVAPGIVLYLLGSSLRFAIAAVVGLVIFSLAMDASTAVVGDYADNVLLGLLTLVFAVFLAPADLKLPILAVGLPVGGWLVFDGLQHLRHGETREEGGLSRYDGGLLWVLLQALFARLLKPFRL